MLVRLLWALVEILAIANAALSSRWAHSFCDRFQDSWLSLSPKVRFDVVAPAATRTD